MRKIGPIAFISTVEEHFGLCIWIFAFNLIYCFSLHSHYFSIIFETLLNRLLGIFTFQSSTLLEIRFNLDWPVIPKVCYSDHWWSSVNFINIKCANFLSETSFWQLFSSYMYVKKMTFVRKIRTFNVEQIDGCEKRSSSFLIPVHMHRSIICARYIKTCLVVHTPKKRGNHCPNL